MQSQDEQLTRICMVFDTVDGNHIRCDGEDFTADELEELGEAADTLTKEWANLSTLQVWVDGLPVIVHMDKVISIRFVRGDT